MRKVPLIVLKREVCPSTASFSGSPAGVTAIWALSTTGEPRSTNLKSTSLECSCAAGHPVRFLADALLKLVQQEGGAVGRRLGVAGGGEEG